jgi:hypothetical protein
MTNVWEHVDVLLQTNGYFMQASQTRSLIFSIHVDFIIVHVAPKIVGTYILIKVSYWNLILEIVRHSVNQKWIAL